MSVKYTPVQWNLNKYLYDAVLLALVAVYILAFLHLGADLADASKPTNPAILHIRAFGSAAFLMLTAILLIGPLARLDARFLPLLYNRRHFGVLTAAVALTHAMHVFNWYFAFTPLNRWEALLTANTAYGQILGFPIEPLGLAALLILLVLAATSHDFWLSFLTAPVWKRMHLLIYPAYGLVVAHVSLGYLQDAKNPAFAMIFAGGAMVVAGAHVAAYLAGPRRVRAVTGWVDVAPPHAFRDGRAITVTLSPRERAAVFLHQGALSAVSNACAHQNGPLGEGRVIDGCVTCPWHGFQYRLADGCAPAPFTEKVPTYPLRLDGGMVQIHSTALPPGTFTEPLAIKAAS